ncbi:hypothetical protein HBI48_083730 [Parastagonospora nodorum]|nr:hypothetical protein HBI48_083730 [Parastagonospora nodorum]
MCDLRALLVRSSAALVDYRYIKRFLCKLFIEVIVFHESRLLGIREDVELQVYLQSKYLFALFLAANVLLPRELDCCNYYVKEASKPTLRAAN